jgi:L-ribulose-5-phosphate 3-epimerase
MIRTSSSDADKCLPFDISLAQRSLNNRLLRHTEPYLDNLDFAKEAKKLGFIAIEYTNRYFMNKGRDIAYINEMKKRADDSGVKSILIMCDYEGDIGEPNESKRKKNVENYYKWADAAKILGCHSIRVNSSSSGTYNQQQKYAADGLRLLCEYCKTLGLNVLVENHRDNSMNADWLVGTVKMVDMPNCGILPDFGNFVFVPGKDRRNNPVRLYSVDIYESVKKMMPYAKGVSGKSYDFNEDGDETSIDFYRMMDIVLASGYNGYVDVEYEGTRLSEEAA